MGTSNKWRDKKFQQGLCWTCGKNPHIPNKKECEECRDKRRIRQKEDYIKGKHSKTKQAISKRRKKLKESGLCTRCGKNQVATGRVDCEVCLEKQRKRSRELKDIVFNKYGGYRCECCGETIQEFLTLDHINNDGAEHRRQIAKNRSGGCGRSLYLWIIRNDFPPIFQVMCANCNTGKKANNGICPHKTKQSGDICNY